MKAFTKEYDYIHTVNGIRYHGIIEADSLDELRKLMQDELDASGGALTPEEFTAADVSLVVKNEHPITCLLRCIDEANTRLRAAGLAEVIVPSEVIPK